MIVEDEYLVMAGVRNVVEACEGDFTVCAQAENGVDGYEKYLELEPDIIITDIRMKRMTGLEMIAKLKELPSFDSEIIVISAYDEFTYAKQSIEFGVKTYILKPIIESELISSLLEAKQKIKKRRLSKSISSQFNMLTNSFLRDVFTKKITDCSEIERICRLYGIKIQNDFYTVAEVRVNGINLPQGEKEELHDLLAKTVKWCAEMNGVKCVLSALDVCDIAVLVTSYGKRGGISSTPPPKVINFFDCINEVYTDLTEHSVLIGHSSEAYGAENLSAAFGEARKALDSGDSAGFDSVLNYLNKYGRKPETILTFSNSEIRAVAKAVEGKEQDEAFDVMNKYFARTYSTPSGKQSHYIKKTMEILRKDYKNQINVLDVAEELSISSYHLMRLIRQETGKTFNGILTELRMEKAKELIREHQYKIYEICDMVGYSDPAYFSKVFQRSVGVSPKKYEESN